LDGGQPYNFAVNGPTEPNVDPRGPNSSSPEGAAPSGASHGRLLALDVGSKTIGLAVSDPLGITAQGLTTIRRKNKRTDLAELERVIAEYGIKELVIGYPLRLSGVEGTQAERVAAFAEELRRRFGLPVHLWDERLTSAEANRLLRQTEMSIRRRAQVVDRMAAVLILQAFMENRKAGGKGSL
jgi:putative Holliday junction resolvase